MFRRVIPGIVAIVLLAARICLAAPDASAPDDHAPRTALLGGFGGLFGPHEHPVYDSAPGDVTPHPAVARIIVPEDGSTAFGSGTLVGVHENRGLVITNWHVVRDAVGLVDVVFPDGFHSHAKPLKVDQDWDLAALVIWKPNVVPVKIATQPPRPGDLLTIHGYGRGKYRIATGHCTQYLAPEINYPHEMVELDVEARQGDSGGPIFNQAGELAGVLFGAGQGTTLGSFAPRVRVFLASVAPELNQPKESALATSQRPPSTPKITGLASVGDATLSKADYPSAAWSPPLTTTANKPIDCPKPPVQLASSSVHAPPQQHDQSTWNDLVGAGWYEPLKTLLAAIGLTGIVLRLLRTVR